MRIDLYLLLCSGPVRSVLEQWAAASRASTGEPNRYRDPEDGKLYRWEPIRPWTDGRATGQTWLVDETTGVETRKTNWRVEATGRVTRAPRFLALVAAASARAAQERSPDAVVETGSPRGWTPQDRSRSKL